MDFSKRTVLVTGAAGAIGKGIAGGFCMGGAKVFITDLEQGAVDTAVKEIGCEGGFCEGLAGDVTNGAQVGEVVSAASKAAIIGMTQSLAYELADYGITVNCLCPGITESTGVWKKVSAGYVENLKLAMDEVVGRFTSKVPLKRLAKVEDIVGVTLFMASCGADYMTGQAINVSGGREMH